MTFWNDNRLVSSYQVRCPDKENYGGGISTGDYDLGFSGLTEHEDELAMIQLAIGRKWLTLPGALEIANISSNDIARNFIADQFHRRSVLYDHPEI